jgi:hypothetical protein
MFLSAIPGKAGKAHLILTCNFTNNEIGFVLGGR